MLCHVNCYALTNVSVEHEASTFLYGLPLNPFNPSDAIWHHTFNSVLHMLQFFLGLERVNPFHPKKCYTTLSSPPKIVAYEEQN
jgi:hypothetical protein